jgi:predicted ribosomally synthesized peptide with SipW-like signal peptide
MKKIILSLGMIVFVGAVIVGATGAFFSDTETSTGNVFAAGAIDLKIDNTSYGFDWNRPNATGATGQWGLNQGNSWGLSDLTDQLFFDFDDLKPGDYGEDTISLHVNDNDAWACMAFALGATPENGQNEPEIAFPDTTAGANEGELQNYLSFIFWNDDGDNVLENDEQVIQSLSGLSNTIFDGDWLAIADSENQKLPLEGGETYYLGKGWCFGEIVQEPVEQDGVNTNPPSVSVEGNRIGFTCSGVGNHNDAQTDGIVVDVGFYAEQSRNNPNFQCSALPSLQPTAGRAVGAVLGDYNEPSQCDVTVDDDGGDENLDTIQKGIAAVASEGTVCVEDGTYTGPVVIDKPLTLASLTGAQNTATINGGVSITSNGVTLTGFAIIPGVVPGDPGSLGVFLNGSLSDVHVTYNNIDGSGGGTTRGVLTTLGSTYTNVFIENNVIHDLTTGIYTNPMLGGPFYIRFNDIGDNVAGIGGLNGTIVAANQFEGNTDEAIGLDGSNDSNPASISNNNFLEGDEVNKYGAWPNFDEGGLAVDAEDNFWGPSGGAVQTNGNVDFLPEAGLIFPHN